MQRRALASSSNHRPRELRRRVILPTLVRSDGGWGNACILNISSRGFLIQASRPTPKGSVVELRHAGAIITARVVWREGARAGLAAESRVPVEEILSASQAPGLQLTAVDVPQAAPRPKTLSHDDHRIRSRMMEFVWVGAIGVSLAGGAAYLVVEALSAPMARVSAALSTPAS